MFSIKKLLLSLILFAPLIQATVYFPQGITAQMVQNADVEVLWDIHDVLAVEDTTAKAGAILKDFFPTIWSKIMGNPAWKEIKKIKETKDISGEAYMYIFLKHGYTKLARMAKNAANAYKPRKGMEQLIFDIHLADITQRVASNIGQDFYANLNLKFKSDFFCNIFDFMQPGKVVDYSIYGPEHMKKKSLDPQVSPFSKPEFGFYDDFNKTYNPDNKVIFIFIDDKIKNIETAVSAGWIGIHLDKKQKNPTATVRAELASLGVFNKKSNKSFNQGIKYV